MRLGIQMINFNKLPQTVDGAASRTGKISGKGCPSAAEDLLLHFAPVNPRVWWRVNLSLCS